MARRGSRIWLVCFRVVGCVRFVIGYDNSEVEMVIQCDLCSKWLGGPEYLDQARRRWLVVRRLFTRFAQIGSVFCDSGNIRRPTGIKCV